jgi:hypothetical protein
MTLQTYAIWDRDTEPMPEARVVVCIPRRGATPVEQTVAVAEALVRGMWFVVPDAWNIRGPLHPRVIPALYAERQDGISGLLNLDAVRAEHRALVLCPSEPLDVGVSLAIGRSGRRDNPLIGIVVIVPPPKSNIDTSTGLRPAVRGGECTICLHEKPMHEATCARVVEPWPLHPAWVRSIVGQCRSVGVPVAFAGWGEWMPHNQGSPDAIATLPSDARISEVVRRDGDMHWIKVGAISAGRLLDGAEVIDVPEWLGST